MIKDKQQRVNEIEKVFAQFIKEEFQAPRSNNRKEVKQ